MPEGPGIRKTLILNLPNMMTFARICCVPLMVGFFFLETGSASIDFGRYGAFLVFCIASVTDYLDGYFARTRGEISNLGRMLDPVADKLLVATCLLLLASDRHQTISGFSLVAAVIILCREILVSGLRGYLAEIRTSVPVSCLAKWKTGIQMVALSVLLIGPAVDGIFVHATSCGLFLLWSAAILTVYTGYDYVHASIKHIREE